MLHAQASCNRGSGPVENQGGPAAGLARYFAVPPAHAMIPSGAQRLHRGFFGGVAGGITFYAIGLRLAIANLAGRVDPLQEPVAEALDGLANAGNFRDVDARANYHVSLN